MGQNTKIEWADHTWNPWFGCTEVSPACDHCYARVRMDTRLHRVEWGAGNDRVRTAPGNWKEPFKWDRAAAAAGKPATVFCLSLGDIWDNEVDPGWRREAFDVMRATPNLIYLLLSKRIGNAFKMTDPLAGNPSLPRNAALGATMINQEEWDRDARKLVDAGKILDARFTFASVEPMLGPIDLRGVLPDWVIVGGESGHHPRPMHPQWARSLRDQCAAAGIPFLFKQWGEWAPGMNPVSGVPGQCALWHDSGWTFFGETPRHMIRFGATAHMTRVGKKAAGRLLDGVEHNGMPNIFPLVTAKASKEYRV